MMCGVHRLSKPAATSRCGPRRDVVRRRVGEVDERGARGARQSVLSGRGGSAAANRCVPAQGASGSSTDARFAALSSGVPRSSFLTGTSSFLPLSVCGTAGASRISSGTCRGVSRVRSVVTIVRSQLVVQPRAAARDDEQAQPVAVVGLLDADHQGLGDLGQGLQHVVEVAAAQPHALPVERRVRAPVHRHAAVGVHGHPVAVPPHAGPGVEVGLGVARGRPGRSTGTPASTASAG